MALISGMTNVTIIIVAAAGLLAGLLVFEKKASTGGKLLTKMPLSALFILTAVFQSHPNPLYYGLLLTGMALCLIGDGCLISTSPNMFLAGLAAFLLAHCFYTFAFFTLARLNPGFFLALILTGAAGRRVFVWLKPHLNKMKRPVTAYIILISLMVCAAAGVFADGSVSEAAGWTVLTGAVLFYLSDICVARNRFVRKGFENRLIGLPLYYSGQFLLALSVGTV